MIKEIDGSFQDKNSELLNDIYLPAKNKADIENSKPFKILKENKQDVTELFTGQKNEMLEPITMKKYQEKDKESNAKFYLNSIKEIGNNLFDFVDQSVIGDTVDYTASGFDKEKIPPTFGILANNIGEFGANLLPVMDKLVDFMGKTPGPDGKIPDVFNNDEKLMEWSGEKVKYFKDNRAKFKAIQEDANMASQFANLVVQDSMVSIPLYEGLTKAGVPRIWATVLGFGMGSAIALEDKLFGMESTFIQEFGKEEVNALKKILSIIPDTPIDAIADEVIQTLEYTAFAFAIGPVIQAAKFMKTNLPSFAVGGAVAGAIEGVDPNTEEPNQEFNLGIDQGKKKSEINFDDQSAVPGTVNEYGFEKTASLKALVNAVIPKKTPVFNSAVKQAVENIAEKGTGDQILGSIKNVPGVKANEIKWIGLDDFLKGKKSVTKKEVVDFVNQNNIDIEEVKFGGGSGKMPEELITRRRAFEDKWVENEMKVLNSSDPSIAPENRLPNRPFSLAEQGALVQNNLNYDSYKLSNKTDGKDITVHFDAMDTYFGEQITSGKIKANELFSGPEAKYTITDLELEKFKIEAQQRLIKSEGNQPKFEDSSYTAPGGEDYTELVFKIKKGGMDVGIPNQVSDGLIQKNKDGKVINKFLNTKIYNSPYRNPNHMNVKSEIAHVRFKTRDLNGKKVLTVEEMQSDFAIATRKANTLSSKFDNQRVTDFPFKNNWYELTTKRLIRYAADNDFDAVAIPKGIVSAKRYGEDITSGIKTVNVSKNSKGQVYVFFKNSNNEALIGHVYSQDGAKLTKTFDELKKEVGEKVYKEIEEFSPKNADHKTDFNLEKEIAIGSGLGKHQLYDKAIPSFLKKYSKKWNAKVYDDNISFYTDDIKQGIFSTDVYKNAKENKMPVTILEITPSMKKSVQEEGQSLFEILGIGGAGAVGAKAVSDSQGNNTISNLTQ